MSHIGLDVAAIRHLARQLSIQSREVDSAIRTVTALVDEVPWQGSDRERFVEHWLRVVVPRLNNASRLLIQASEEATRSAEGQERVSRS